MADEQDIIGLAAAGHRIGRSARTMKLWIKQGRLTARRVGGRWHVNPHDLANAAGTSHLMDTQKILRDNEKILANQERFEAMISELRTLNEQYERRLRRLEQRENQEATANEHPDLSKRVAIADELCIHGLSKHTVLKWLDTLPEIPFNNLAEIIQLTQLRFTSHNKRGRGRHLHQCHIRAYCWCRDFSPALPDV